VKIRFYAHASFRLEVDGFAVITDPYTPGPQTSGFDPIDEPADLVIMSSATDPFHSDPSHVRGDPTVVNALELPPEGAEARGLHVRTFPAMESMTFDFGRDPDANAMYLFTLGGVRVLHMGDIGNPISREHLDEADDPVVHHQLEAGPSPRLPKPEGSAPYRIEKGCAIQTALFTEEGCERIMRFAFELALKRERKKVTSVTKSNAQQYSSVLWDEVFARVSAEYPDVETEQWLVDAIAARFVLRPETLEVVVASNLFADILSDLGGALAGSLGVAASANLDPRRRRPSMFEPVHGSAPDIAGKGIANPVGALSSAALMLEHLGLEEEAERVDRAIEATTGSWLLTPDLGGTSTTREVGDAALAYLSRGPEPA
jgi:hypothetical protein